MRENRMLGLRRVSLQPALPTDETPGYGKESIERKPKRREGRDKDEMGGRRKEIGAGWLANARLHCDELYCFNQASLVYMAVHAWQWPANSCRTKKTRQSRAHVLSMVDGPSEITDYAKEASLYRPGKKLL